MCPFCMAKANCSYHFNQSAKADCKRYEKALFHLLPLALAND